MHKFPIFNYKRAADLPYSELDKQKFAIYIIDFQWNCIFVNKHALQVHQLDYTDIAEKNFWSELQQKMEVDSEFKVFINKVQSGNIANITTISAMSKKRVSVTGYPLEDAYYFAVTILPNKESLMDELRNELTKNKGK